MNERRTDPLLQDLNRGLLIAAAVLLAVASVAGLAGFTVFSAALIAATRRWYRRADLASTSRRPEVAAGQGRSRCRR